ncbi:hypothetical protein C0Q70_02406 [Pomacea canaliculata]|uniref:G-protein coupled receptors family 1 profile domain-containing protein n=1 Tax=Pomacea canaliculata TaxID=400727 RepID=A0A2T7PPT8_POMCA|nr:hypothetical protein C0Q70_02406 [Pomacea canaliculata]
MFSSPSSSRTIYSTSLSASQEVSTQKSHEYFVKIPPAVHYIEMAGIVPMAFLGTLGNIIALIVWTAETRYNATTLLLKHLCVWDSLFLLTYATLLLGREAKSAEVFYATQFFIVMFLWMSLHLTLLVVVTRLVAVTRPLHVRDLLTRCRVYVVYVGIIVWCLLFASLQIVVNKIEHFELIERVFHLLQVLNSSVNIIFYAACSTRFRQLFLCRVQQISGLVRFLSTSLLSSTKREVQTADL